jgi:hypothetical protein
MHIAVMALTFFGNIHHVDIIVCTAVGPPA